MFQRYGVPEYWIVDPVRETIEMYRLAESAYELAGAFSSGEEMRSGALPGLTFGLGVSFRLGSLDHRRVRSLRARPLAQRGRCSDS